MKTINKLTHFKSVISTKQFYRNLLLVLFLFSAVNQLSAIPPTFTTKNIKFLSEGDSLAGTIFTPKHISAAVVMVHGSGQEKE